MKAISTFMTLLLIITTCATSAILYLNENYDISAGSDHRLDRFFNALDW